MSNGKQGAVIAVLNMKGGVGKTVLSANVFREVFALHHTPTLLVDFDAQFNLTQLLLTRKEYDDLKAQKKTIFHVLEPPEPDNVFDVSENDMSDTGKLADYVCHIESYAGPPEVSLDLLAGDFRLARMNIREQPALRTPHRRSQR